MTINNPIYWEDLNEQTPPVNWEFFDTDERYYFADAIGNNSINYIGEIDLPPTVTVDWEVIQAEGQDGPTRLLVTGVEEGTDFPLNDVGQPGSGQLVFTITDPTLRTLEFSMVTGGGVLYGGIGAIALSAQDWPPIPPIVDARMLFLDLLADQFTARDDAGDPLPEATLTFYRSATTILTPAYADAGLTTPLANPLTSSSSGLFPTIYLNNAEVYRVLLHTAQGVLRWDVDPYVYHEENPTYTRFRTPANQVLVDGRPIAGAVASFFATGTDNPLDVFADGEHVAHRPNPTRADAAGFLPPIYMDGIYKIVLQRPDGSLIEEIDPFPDLPER